MSVKSDVDLLLISLGDLDEVSQVLASAAKALALEIDLNDPHAEKPKSNAGAVRELRATLAELTERCRRGANPDDEDGWGFPAGSGAPQIRDAT